MSVSSYNISNHYVVKDFDYMIKLIVVGSSGVGKSSLLMQFTDSVFEAKMETTVGVEFGVKILNIAGAKIKLQIWDTGGQESFRAITANYYRGAHGGLLVFDVSNRVSFMALDSWLKEIYQYSDPCVTFILCGNKIDLDAQRSVDTEEAEEFAKQNGMLYVETSAKDATNVQGAFNSLCISIVEKVASGLLQTTSRKSTIITPDDDIVTPVEKKGCCT